MPVYRQPPRPEANYDSLVEWIDGGRSLNGRVVWRPTDMIPELRAQMGPNIPREGGRSVEIRACPHDLSDGHVIAKITPSEWLFMRQWRLGYGAWASMNRRWGWLLAGLEGTGYFRPSYPYIYVGYPAGRVRLILEELTPVGVRRGQVNADF